MFLSDQHLHSTFSFDGQQTIEEACGRYEALGFDHICFTEHLDLGNPDPAQNVLPDFAAWKQALAEARARHPRLRICAGLEMAHIQETAGESQQLGQKLQLDFHLLSLHVVDGLDPYHPTYYQGRTREAAYQAYALALLESVNTWEDYDAVAHVGFCAKFAPYPLPQRPFTFQDAPEELDAVLESMIQKGKYLEINTSGIQVTGHVIPHPSILRRYVEKGGDAVTFGTDAHGVERIGEGIRGAMEEAKGLGVRYGVVFEGRKEKRFSLSY